MKIKVYHLPDWARAKSFIVIRLWGNDTDYEFFDAWDENEETDAMIQSWGLRGGRVITPADCE